ncbi:MipA/OmpV family protein [Sphingomonas sp. R86521]|uniref:MipA/OmpV family protein n=1 Tax=Sphingomonas sp. R86521 TaxID=3093860 RepID=UPI0036D3813F
MRAFSLALSVAVLASASPVLAQNAPNAAPPGVDGNTAPDNNRLTIGIGAATLPDYEGADSNSITPGAVAIGVVGGHDFFTRGTQLYVNLLKSQPGPVLNYEIGVIGAARFQRTGKVDNRQVRALGEIDSAYEVGGYAGVSKTGVITSEYDTLTARVAYVHDVSNTHDSYVITPQINYTTPLSIRTLVSIGASADYVGKGYGRTYFGVSPIGTRLSGLRTYDINDSGFKNFNVSAFVLQSLSGDIRHGWGLGAGVLYGRMLGKYKNSPLVRDVGDADQLAAAAGLTYTF